LLRGGREIRASKKGDGSRGTRRPEKGYQQKKIIVMGGGGRYPDLLRGKQRTGIYYSEERIKAASEMPHKKMDTMSFCKVADKDNIINRLRVDYWGDRGK